MSTFRIAALIAVLLAGSTSMTVRAADVHAAPTANSQPNIVYILCDDLGYGDVSCLNADGKLATPNMDSIARDGMTFIDAHSGSAVCTPTRYGILTGRYAFRSRLKKGVLYGYDAPLIEPGRLTVAQLLRDKGYATACIGKWHLGLGWALLDGAKPAGEKNVDFSQRTTAGPQTVGFDYSYIIPASLDMDPYVYLEDGKAVELPTQRVASSPRPAFWRAGPAAPSFKHMSVLLTITEKAQSFIKQHAASPGGKRQPFFLYLPLTSPHTPHVPRPEFRGKSGAGNYGDFVEETDWSVGQILETLQASGSDKDTLVILTSDNGAHMEPIMKELKGHAANGEFRGQKSDAWDGGHHIPLLVRWPGVTPAGSKCAQTVCLTDLMATVAELTGADLPNDAAEDSVSMLPLLRGQVEKPTRDATIHHSIDGAFAIRQGQWKLIIAKGSGGWSLPEKRAAAQDLPSVQLYDMQADIREQKNVQAEHPDEVKKLNALLQKYLDDGRSVPER